MENNPTKKIRKLQKPYKEMKGTGHRIRPYGEKIQFGGWTPNQIDEKKYRENYDLIDWTKRD